MGFIDQILVIVWKKCEKKSAGLWIKIHAQHFFNDCCYSGFTPDDIKRKIPPRIKASGSMIPITTVPTPTFRFSPLNSSFVSSPVKKTTLAFAHSCILLCIFYALFISALISFSFLYLLCCPCLPRFSRNLPYACAVQFLAIPRGVTNMGLPGL